MASTSGGEEDAVAPSTAVVDAGTTSTMGGGEGEGHTGAVEGGGTASPITVLDLDLRLTVLPDALPVEKAECPTCHKRHYHYCPFHFRLTFPPTAVDENAALASDALTVRLPLHVDVLRGRDEKAEKSTAAHLAALAPEDTTMWFLPDFPAYADPSTVLVLFPSPNSRSVAELPDVDRYTHLVAIDTTWQKTGALLLTPQMRHPALTFVRIGSYHTKFWRYQSLGAHCVSTLEAVYFLCREVAVERARRRHGGGAAHLPHPCDPGNLWYTGAFDNLLLFFLHTYHRIQTEYTTTGKRYNDRMRQGYIQSPAGGAGHAPLTGVKRRRVEEWDDAAGAGSASRSDDDGGGDGVGGKPDTDGVVLCRPVRMKGAWAVAPDLLTPTLAVEEVARLHKYVVTNGVALPGVAGGAQAATVGGGASGAGLAEFSKAVFEQKRETLAQVYGTKPAVSAQQRSRATGVPAPAASDQASPADPAHPIMHGGGDGGAGLEGMGHGCE